MQKFKIHSRIFDRMGSYRKAFIALDHVLGSTAFQISSKKKFRTPAKSITKFEKGQSGKIIGFTNDEIAGKLVAMGILPGSKIEVVRTAPLNGAYYIKVDGNNIAVRKNEAESIVLEF